MNTGTNQKSDTTLYSKKLILRIIVQVSIKNLAYNKLIRESLSPRSHHDTAPAFLPLCVDFSLQHENGKKIFGQSPKKKAAAEFYSKLECVMAQN